MVLGQYRAVLVGTWWYWVSIGHCWLVLGGTGSVYGGVGAVYCREICSFCCYRLLLGGLKFFVGRF